jgi:hypothetical protein
VCLSPDADKKTVRKDSAAAGDVMPEERRRHPRIPLDNILYVTLQDGRRETTCVLLDLSVSGARLGIAPNDTLPERHKKITFKQTGCLGTILAELTAIVMWSRGVQFGVLFERELPVPLGKLAELLDSQIFY